MINKITRKIKIKKQNIEYTKDRSEYQKYDIGDYTYGFPKISSFGKKGGNLKIGKFCSIGGNVEIYLGGNHRIDWTTTYPFSVIYKQFKHIDGHPSTKGDVIIGNDVWIANNAVILSGIKIGDGAVIANSAIVVKDVPPYSIVGGNPAKEIKKRFNEDIIEKLLKIKWWNWDMDKIMKNVPDMLTEDLSHFVNEHYKKN